MDNNYTDLDNKYLLAVFEKHLCPLVNKGFQSHTFFPETYDQPLKLIYTGSFNLEVVRDFPCNTYINLSPRYLAGLREANILLSQLIYTLSGHQKYIGNYFQEIGCYYLDYENNIQKICECFFVFFDEVQEVLRQENYPNFKVRLKADEVGFLKKTGFYPPDYNPPKVDHFS